MPLEATIPAAGDAVVTPATVTTPATETPSTSPNATEPAIEGQTGEPAADQQGQQDDKEKRNRPTFKDRFHEVYGKYKERGREIGRLRSQIAQYERPIRPPNIEALDFDQRETLRTREAIRAERANETRSQLREVEQDAHEALVEVINVRNQDFTERLTAHEARDPGVFKKFAETVVHEDMAQFIGDSPVGPEIASYLTRDENRAELRQLQRLTDPARRPSLGDLREADRLMSRIEARVERAPVRKATTAPDPGTTLHGRPSPGQSKTLEQMSGNMDEFAPALLKKLGLARK